MPVDALQIPRIYEVLHEGKLTRCGFALGRGFRRGSLGGVGHFSETIIVLKAVSGNTYGPGIRHIL